VVGKEVTNSTMLNLLKFLYTQAVIASAAKQSGWIGKVCALTTRLLRCARNDTTLETLKILLDQETFTTITQSFKEMETGKGIPIDEW